MVRDIEEKCGHTDWHSNVFHLWLYRHCSELPRRQHTHTHSYIFLFSNSSAIAPLRYFLPSFSPSRTLMAAASASFAGSAAVAFKSNRISNNSAITSGGRIVSFYGKNASSVQLQRSLSYSQCGSKLSLSSSGMVSWFHTFVSIKLRS